MIQTYYYDTAGFTEDGTEYRRLYDGAAECRKRKADRYRFFKDKCLCLAAGNLLSRALADFGSTLTEDDAVIGEKGKPFFKDEQLFFNLSHSGHLAACVMSNEGPVGIDAEEISEARMDVARRFFSRGENDALADAESDDKRDALFTMLWTLKESCLKVTGAGLSGELSSFDFSPFLDSLPDFSAQFGGSSFSFHTLKESGCCISICCMIL